MITSLSLLAFPFASVGSEVGRVFRLSFFFSLVPETPFVTSRIHRTTEFVLQVLQRLFDVVDRIACCIPGGVTSSVPSVSFSRP